MATIVKEASTCSYEVRFYDTSNSPAIPGTVRYLIRDLTNDRVVKDWTSVEPAATVTIRISAQDNNLYRTRRPKIYEKRVLVVQTDADQEAQNTDEEEYWIYNLSGLVS
jgi:flagellar hook assembly protein FlgD